MRRGLPAASSGLLLPGSPTAGSPMAVLPLAVSLRAVSLLAVFLLACIGRSASAAPPDTQITFDQVVSTWTVAANGTWVVDAEITIRAPKDNPTHVVRLPLSWSSSIETLEVVQARIDKEDGRSIIAPLEAVREDSPSGDMYFHEFSDERRILITFTDCEPGDLLIVHTRRDVAHPRVPGGFMSAPVLDRGVGWEETNYTISVPSDMHLSVETNGFDDQKELVRDRIVHYLHSPRMTPRPKELAVMGAFDRLPRFAASTFRDWDEFGRAYASVLLPHAKVTPSVTALALKLTQGLTTPDDQARALYEWVRDHVRTIPIPLEESRRDPNDADQIMTKLYGDTKDHAVLLYALLAARNIPAEMVLLNASNTATISDTPNIRPMDHLILFLPSLNRYADSTVDVAPFGQLPFAEIGKPAIHLGGSGLARRTIPLPASGDNRADLKTEMTLAEDGAVAGTSVTRARGAFGIWLRMAAKSFAENESSAAVTLLRDHGTPGTGHFSFDPPTALGDGFTIRGTLQLQNQSALLRGGFFTMWTGLRILPRPGDVLSGPMFLRDLTKAQPTFCYPGVQSETLTLTMPPGRSLGTLPRDLSIDTEFIHYRSHWALDGQRVSVTRSFESQLPGPMCAGARREDLFDQIAAIRSDLVNPIGITLDTLPPPRAEPGTDDLGDR